MASIALITNNVVGPAMMGLPYLFKHAGILPVVVFGALTWISSSLCGTLLADTIARIPGNSKFTKHILFCNAFHIIVGGKWYTVAEGLFLSSCFIQACAGLVETAHGLDGLFCSFVFGRSYALQVYPTISLLTWSPVGCDVSVLADDIQCVPFSNAGPFIITLGFVTATLLFFPIGCYHLKETMTMQYVSFSFLFVLVILFCLEFFHLGLNSHVPWVGKDLSKLAGVVLFNYSVTLTVPSWLDEKIDSVSVNGIIWGSTSLATVMYLCFGILAALAFDDVTEDALVILASSQVCSMLIEYDVNSTYSRSTLTSL